MTEKQKKFCEEYLIDHNASKAALRAGYSEKTASQSSGKILTRDDVKAYISELMVDGE